MKRTEKISSIILLIVGVIIVVDTILAQFFMIGNKQNSLTLVYCIAFVLLCTQFPNILKKKYVVIPMYIMIIQMFYSLFSKLIW